MSFATDSFREEDVHRLSEDLNKAAGIHSYVNKTSKKNEEGEDQWKIRFGARADVDKFFRYLDHANQDALKVAKQVFPQKFPVE